ncbi:hypothetical protein BKD26_25920 [Streptomyces sp. CB03238]|nr:hypothetical protein BKD26_25920 [Streptomyces sp. CB03238]
MARTTGPGRRAPDFTVRADVVRSTATHAKCASRTRPSGPGPGPGPGPGSTPSTRSPASASPGAHGCSPFPPRCPAGRAAYGATTPSPTPSGPPVLDAAPTVRTAAPGL